MNYFKNLKELLKDKAITNTVLLIIALTSLFLTRKFCVDTGLFYLWFVFISSYVIQTFLLLKKSYVFYVFRVVMVFLIAIQAYWIYDGYRRATIKTDYFGSMIMSSEYTPHGLVHNDNDTIFNVIYRCDDWKRRIPETRGEVKDTSNIENKKHAIFVGCSFTAGYGLDNSSTFPFLFEQLNPEYKSYNYGSNGYGTHNIALLFDSGSNVINKSLIKEKDGFMLYTYITDHLDRVYGTSDYLSWAPTTFVHNVHIDHDSLVIKELPVWHRFLVVIIHKITNRIALFRYLNVQLNYPRSEKFYRRFADIVNYIAKKYWEINPLGDFYVAIYPYWTTNDTLIWTNYLSPSIKVLKMNPPADFYERLDEYTIWSDGHPAKLLNEYYINKVNELIRQDK